MHKILVADNTTEEKESMVVLMNITSDIKYVGVNDLSIDLFEGMYKVPEGMSYNSYVIMDEKIAVVDTVDASFTEEWLGNMAKALKGRKPDYLIVQHMEPDHSANIVKLVEHYPQIMLVSSMKAFEMMRHYFGTEFARRRMVIEDGDILSLGKHKLRFVTAPMVHWPEVTMTYDMTEGALFSADAFGRFGAIVENARDDESDSVLLSEWAKEASRYYFGIVGKYGTFVQKLLQKIKQFDVKQICPLHGPILKENIGEYVGLYDTWSAYLPEKRGVVIAYTSVYGNTQRIVRMMAERFRQAGVECVVHDLARCDRAEVISDAFRYDRMVLATTTYNAGIFPFMMEFIIGLKERNFGNRKIGFVENGGWAPIAAKIMREQLSQCKNISFAEPVVRMISVEDENTMEEIEGLIQQLC